MKFGEWLETWLELYVSSAGLRPSTVAMYARAVHAVPRGLAARPLEAVTCIEIQRWLVGVAKATPRAAQLDRVMVMRAVRVARKAGLCSIVLDDDTLPQIHHAPKETQTLTAQEAQAYLQEIRKCHSYALLLLMLVAGLRRGEALGLQWGDVDQKTFSITIRRQRTRANHAYKAAPLKTRASERTLTLPGAVMEIIDAQPRQLSGWLVDTTPEALQKDHRAALIRAGIPAKVTLHGLRHTMATLAASSGIPMKLLQVSLGHSSYKLTADLYAAHIAAQEAGAVTLVWQGLAARA